MKFVSDFRSRMWSWSNENSGLTNSLALIVDFGLTLLNFPEGIRIYRLCSFFMHRKILFGLFSFGL